MSMENNTSFGTALIKADSAKITADEASAMMRVALNLFERWQLSNQEAIALLGHPTKRTFSRWKSGEIKSVPYDTAWRLSCLMGIHGALRILFR